MQKDGKLYKKMGAQGQEARCQGSENGKSQTQASKEDDTAFDRIDALSRGRYRGIYL